jgi:hypothetical protein
MPYRTLEQNSPKAERVSTLQCAEIWLVRASLSALPKRLPKRDRREIWAWGPKTARTGTPKIAPARERAQ